MMDSYPDKVFYCQVSYLKHGPNHYCLVCVFTIRKLEHSASTALQPYVLDHPQPFGTWSRRVFTNVLFQNIVVDRLEATIVSQLSIVAINMNRFPAVVHEISAHLANYTQHFVHDHFKIVTDSASLHRYHISLQCQIQFLFHFWIGRLYYLVYVNYWAIQSIVDNT